MSARVTALVWSKYATGAGEMLLALALADQCTDSGEYIALDIARLARKTRQAEATVREQLRRMADAGWLLQMDGSKAFRISPEWLGAARPSPEAADPTLKAAKAVAKRAHRLPDDWELPDEYRDWALKEFPAWTAESVAKVATTFRNHWTSAGGPNARKVDWLGTWRNWCAKEPAVPGGAAGGVTAGQAAGSWWLSSAAIEQKAVELGLPRIDGELWPQWRDRIFTAAGPGPWSKLVYKAPTPTSTFKTASSQMGAELLKMKEATGAGAKV